MNTVSPHRPSFSPHPLALLGAAFAAGALIASLVNLPPAAPLVCCAVATALVILMTFTQATREPSGGKVSLLLTLACACAGATLATLERETSDKTRTRVRALYENGEIASGEPVELTGVLARAPEWSPDGSHLTLRVERLRYKQDEREASGNVELFAPLLLAGERSAAREEYQALELRRGARLRVMVVLSRAERFRNPGVSSSKEFLDRRGIDATGTIKSPLLVERLDDAPVFLPLAWLDRLRAAALERVNKLFSTDTAGMLNASLLGNRDGLTRGVAERFREGGTFHVLVISGLHITFLGGLAWGIARRVTRRRAWQFACSALLVWGYAVAVGAEASVVRAALMFTAVALAPVVGRRASGANALGGAALALLVWRPRDLFDPSFQLTFLSVLIIVAVAWPLLSKLKAVGEWRPTRATPRPPVCPAWWRTLGELLFWSEENWRREAGRTTYSYRLFKTPRAAPLERLRAQRPLRYAFAAVLVSLCVQLGMLPLQVLYFHRLSFASFVLNVFVGLGVAFASLCALAALALSQLGEGLSAPFVWLVERAAWLMTHSVDPFTSAGAASVRLPEYTGALASLYILYYVPLVYLTAALARWRPVRAPHEATDANGDDEGLGDDNERERVSHRKSSRLKIAAASFVTIFLLLVMHPFSASRPDGRLHVSFLDVGQGDAALVTMPDGATILIDGGGRPHFGRGQPRSDDSSEPFERDVRSIGEAVVSEHLWWRGLDAVDYVIATHADADHIDGLNDALDNFRVHAALVGRAPAGDEEYRRFAETARKNGVAVHAVARGDRLQFGAVEIVVLWPPRASDFGRAPSGNDDSVVLRVKFGERAFLLTGDVEKAAESMLLAGGESELRCDAIKVPHHGSRTSSTESFVRAARPKLAVVSVGLDSPFGHPHPEVVERWRDAGAEVLTTGARGTITLSTDGHDLKVETHVNP